MHKGFLKTGAAFAGLAVIFGAFGAHALKAKLSPEELMVYETAVRYQMYHAFALIICGMLFSSFAVKSVLRAGYLFIAGIVLFSGSLYLINFLEAAGNIVPAAVGILTPLGGLCFIVGWLFVFLSVAGERNAAAKMPGHRGED